MKASRYGSASKIKPNILIQQLLRLLRLNKKVGYLEYKGISHNKGPRARARWVGHQKVTAPGV